MTIGHQFLQGLASWFNITKLVTREVESMLGTCGLPIPHVQNRKCEIDPARANPSILLLVRNGEHSS